MGILTTYLFAGAVVALVLGVVLGAYGGRLRHTAIVLFTLALLPSVVLPPLRAVGTSIRIDPMPALVVLALVSVASYMVLQARTKGQSRPKRVQMKRPYTHRGDTDFIEFLRREIDRDA